MLLLLPFFGMAQSQTGKEELSLKSKNCYTKNGLGLDLGIGTTAISMNEYGYRYGYNHGVVFETELGLNLTRYSFIAFSYNLLSLFVEDYPASVLLHTCQLRIGFNLGK